MPEAELLLIGSHTAEQISMQHARLHSDDQQTNHKTPVLSRHKVSHGIQSDLFALQDDNAKQGKFGFAVNNTIGGNPQPNGWMDNWVDFFRERRLKHMLRLVNDSRLTEMGERVAKNMDKMFEGVEVLIQVLLLLQVLHILLPSLSENARNLPRQIYDWPAVKSPHAMHTVTVQVKPSLLHGDLWSGNLSVVEGGQWAILDPACYYGQRTSIPKLHSPCGVCLQMYSTLQSHVSGHLLG